METQRRGGSVQVSKDQKQRRGNYSWGLWSGQLLSVISQRRLCRTWWAPQQASTKWLLANTDRKTLPPSLRRVDWLCWWMLGHLNSEWVIIAYWDIGDLKIQDWTIIVTEAMYLEGSALASLYVELTIKLSVRRTVVINDWDDLRIKICCWTTD